MTLKDIHELLSASSKGSIYKSSEEEDLGYGDPLLS